MPRVAAGVYSDGFALKLAVSAAADADIFSIEASGTIQINTTGQTRLGIARGFLLDMSGKVSVLKVLNFDAHLLIEFKDSTTRAAGWTGTCTRTPASTSSASPSCPAASTSTATATSGSRSPAGWCSGSDDFGLVGNFSILV